MFNQIKSTPFYYSKTSQSTLNLNDLSIYHPRHKVEKTEESTFVTQISKPKPPLTQKHKHQRVLDFTDILPPVKQQSLPTLKGICKTESSYEYTIQNHLSYLTNQQQYSINQLIKRLDHIDKIGDDTGKNILSQLEEFDNKKTKNNILKGINGNKVFKFRGGWQTDEQDTIRQNKLTDNSDKETILNSDRESKKGQQQINPNSYKMPKLQKYDSGNGRKSPQKTQFKVSPLLQKQVIQNRRRALVVKRLSFKLSFYQIEGDPLDINKIEKILHLFKTLHEQMVIICNEHKHAYHTIERLNGYGDLIRKFIFDNLADAKVLKHSSGEQMFEDFLTQLSISKGYSLQSKNLVQLIEEIQNSQLYKRLVYFGSSLKTVFQHRQEQKTLHNIENKKQIQNEILKGLSYVNNQKDYQMLLPTKMNLPKRSIQQQIDKLSQQHQPLLKFSELELLKAQMMELDEQEMVKHRDE